MNDKFEKTWTEEPGDSRVGQIMNRVKAGFPEMAAHAEVTLWEWCVILTNAIGETLADQEDMPYAMKVDRVQALHDIMKIKIEEKEAGLKGGGGNA